MLYFLPIDSVEEAENDVPDRKYHLGCDWWLVDCPGTSRCRPRVCDHDHRDPLRLAACETRRDLLHASWQRDRADWKSDGSRSPMMTAWQVATSAEAFAAAQFARYGWNVSVQYGANQPEYDLVAVKGDRFLKISVKGSQDGSWGLTQSYLANADYHSAADAWMKKHTPKTTVCLVQFKGVALDALPRMYLATPSEIAEWLKKEAKGRGDTILYEKKVWTNRAKAYGTIDQIPKSWKFTEERLNLLEQFWNSGIGDQNGNDRK